MRENITQGLECDYINLINSDEIMLKFCPTSHWNERLLQNKGQITSWGSRRPTQQHYSLSLTDGHRASGVDFEVI